MAEQPLSHAFEAGLAAARIPPDEHLGEMQQFMFHDSAQTCPHVMAGHTANRRLGPVSPRLSQQLGGDGNLEGPASVSWMEPRSGAAPGAGHPHGNAEGQAMLSAGDCLGDGRVEKVSVNRSIERIEIGAAEPLEIRVFQQGRGVRQFLEDPFKSSGLFDFGINASLQELGEAAGHGKGNQQRGKRRARGNPAAGWNPRLPDSRSGQRDRLGGAGDGRE